MRVRIPRFVAGGLAATALAAAIGGAAFAQTPSASPTGAPPVKQRAEELLSSVAAKLGKTPDELRAAVVAAQKERVAAQAQAGQLTQEQADRLNQRIDQTGGLGLFGGHKMGPGKHGPGKGGPAMGLRGAFGGPELARFLGLQPQELMAELRAGKSLAQVAQEKGKSRDELKSHLTAQHKAQLDAAVQAGRLTQEQVDQRQAKFSSRVDQMIDRTGPVGGKGGRPGKGGFGPRGVPAPATGA